VNWSRQLKTFKLKDQIIREPLKPVAKTQFEQVFAYLLFLFFLFN